MNGFGIYAKPWSAFSHAADTTFRLSIVFAAAQNKNGKIAWTQRILLRVCSSSNC